MALPLEHSLVHQLWTACYSYITVVSTNLNDTEQLCFGKALTDLGVHQNLGQVPSFPFGDNFLTDLFCRCSKYSPTYSCLPQTGMSREE
jgi:hypothetical protein